jgi:hypothetical protein
MANRQGFGSGGEPQLPTVSAFHIFGRLTHYDTRHQKSTPWTLQKE